MSQTALFLRAAAAGNLLLLQALADECHGTGRLDIKEADAISGSGALYLAGTRAPSAAAARLLLRLGCDPLAVNNVRCSTGCLRFAS